MRHLFFLIALTVMVPITHAEEQETKEPRNSIKGSGLPIPRFVMTKSKKVKLRVGPGDHYPSRTTYIQKNIPLMVIAEFEYWRKTRDFDNEEGWIHKSLLMDAKNVWIKENNVSLLSSSEPNGSATALLSKRVAVKVLKLSGSHAKITVDDQIGWISTQYLWGILPQ